jgi:predicted metalloprotease with PDZ domain
MGNPTIRYRVSAPRPANHLIHVEMEVDAPPSDALELRLPVWTPGSYMVREFARNIQGFAACGDDGRELPWRKTRKDTWRISTSGARTATASFDVYAHELTVRTSHLDQSHLFFNAANVLPYTPDRMREPALVEIRVPDGWRIATGLTPVDGAPGTFLATDYDELVDSPVHAGPDPIIQFTAAGKPHAIATWGRSNLDPARLGADVGRIVEAQAALFGGLPYDSYTFILMLTGGARGGLEHRNSSSLMVPRFNFRAGRTYDRALQLISHEFFHTWNVKRIRPQWNDERFNYAAENYTGLLWAMEGITEYYTSLMLRRAGLISPDRYLEILTDEIRELADTPGRGLQSLEEASFDAWIKYYRPDEHSANSSVSYYLKGMLVSLLLDLEMRRRSGGQQSLDDLMRLLWERHGQTGRGVPEDAYPRLVGEITGADWAEFFDRYVSGYDELDYAPGLRAMGIELDEQRDSATPEGWLGLRTRSDGGRPKVTAILSNGPAWDSGLAPGDELLALDGFRLEDAAFTDRLRDYGVGDVVHLTAFHGDQLIQVPVNVAARPSRVTLRRSRKATVQQRTMYEAWLAAPWE